MRHEEPLFSVILTTRDRPRLLALALDCYRYQTYTRRELIVVDDGERFPVESESIAALKGQLVRLPAGTPLGTKLNVGVERAHGTVCQKMDDDDWYAPIFLDSMTAALRNRHVITCTPIIAFLMPFLFFDLERWEIRQSHEVHASGATLMFSRRVWEMRQFRALFQDEDVWFFADQLQLGAQATPVRAMETYLAVRHSRSMPDRGHTCTHLHQGRTVEDALQHLPLYNRCPEDLLPDFALKLYRDLR